MPRLLALCYYKRDKAQMAAGIKQTVVVVTAEACNNASMAYGVIPKRNRNGSVAYTTIGIFW